MSILLFVPVSSSSSSDSPPPTKLRKRQLSIENRENLPPVITSPASPGDRGRSSDLSQHTSLDSPHKSPPPNSSDHENNLQESQHASNSPRKDSDEEIEVCDIGTQTSLSRLDTAIIMAALDDLKATFRSDLKKATRSHQYDVTKKFDKPNSNLAVNCGLLNLNVSESTDLTPLGMTIPIETIEDFDKFEDILKTNEEKRELVVSIFLIHVIVF